MSRTLLFLMSIVIMCSSISAQVHNHSEVPLSISTSNTQPHQSAILDLSAVDKGVLVPRMTSTERLAINSPANGLLVYDVSTNSFWYWVSTSWNEIAYSSSTPQMLSHISDVDNDTRVETETLSDDDKVRFFLDNVEYLSLAENTNNEPHINISNTDNVIIGKNAGRKVTGSYTSGSIGQYNLMMGALAGQNFTEGAHNTFVGYRAGDLHKNNPTGNTFIGSNVGTKFSSGSSDSNYNTGLGYAALSHNLGGNGNVAIGALANSHGSDTNNNVYVGFQAGWSNNDGDNNVMIGRHSGQSSDGSGNIFIGRDSGKFYSTEDNYLVIENSDSFQPLIIGEFSNDKVGINWDKNLSLPNTLSVNGDASKTTAGDWLANSDRRLKKDIVHLDSKSMLDKLLKMQGVSFLWDDNVTGFDRPESLQYGFIAQDIQKVWSENVSSDEQGYYQTPYGTYDFLYVESIKQLHKENLELNEKVSLLEDELTQLKSMVTGLLRSTEEAEVKVSDLRSN